MRQEKRQKFGARKEGQQVQERGQEGAAGGELAEEVGMTQGG